MDDNTIDFEQYNYMHSFSNNFSNLPHLEPLTFPNNNLPSHNLPMQNWLQNTNNIQNNMQNFQHPQKRNCLRYNAFCKKTKVCIFNQRTILNVYCFFLDCDFCFFLYFNRIYLFFKRLIVLLRLCAIATHANKSLQTFKIIKHFQC